MKIALVLSLAMNLAGHCLVLGTALNFRKTVGRNGAIDWAERPSSAAAMTRMMHATMRGSCRPDASQVGIRA